MIYKYRQPKGIALMLTSAAELMAPRHCEICGSHIGISLRHYEFFCNQCIEKLDEQPDPDEILNDLLSMFPEDSLGISAAYCLTNAKTNAGIMDAIYSLKYSGRSKIGIELGALLGEFLISVGAVNYDFLIPMPIHHARVRERGYNQSEEIAKGLNAVTKIPVQTGLIKRAKYTRSQTQLNKYSRIKNLSGAFSSSKNSDVIKGKRFLLIDDVLTTGSTMNEGANCLLNSGAKKIDAAAIVKA